MLTKRCGPGGFDYLAGMGRLGDLDDLEEIDFEEMQQDRGRETGSLFQDDEDAIEVEFEKKD
jgi:hypothetical protein